MVVDVCIGTRGGWGGRIISTNTYVCSSLARIAHTNLVYKMSKSEAKAFELKQKR